MHNKNIKRSNISNATTLNNWENNYEIEDKSTTLSKEKETLINNIIKEIETSDTIGIQDNYHKVTFKCPEYIDIAKPFNKIIFEMAELYEKKNQDYGNAFGQLFNEYGINYAIMHLHEKLNRIKSVTKNNKHNNESIKDSLIDMANYAIMTIIELNNQNDN